MSATRLSTAWRIIAALVLLVDACGPDPAPKNLQIRKSGAAIWGADLPSAGVLMAAAAALGSAPGTPLGEPKSAATNAGAGDVSLWMRPPAGGTQVLTMKALGGSPPERLTFRQQAEAEFFVRDLTELYATLVAIKDDLQKWRAIATNGAPVSLTRGISLLHPEAPKFDPSIPAETGSLSPVNVWGGREASLRGFPASAPDGTGSIKSVRAFYHGLCDVITPTPDIVQSVSDQLSSSLQQGICVDGLGGNLDYLDVLSFLGGPALVDVKNHLDPGGGFLLHGRARLHDSGMAWPFSLSDCTVAFTTEYQFALTQGFLSVTAIRHNFDYDASRSLCSGFLGHKGFADTLADGLQLDFPDRFNRAAKAAQTFTVPEGADFGQFDCDLGGPSEEVCANAIGWMKRAVESGAKSASIDLHNTPLTAAFQSANWTCVAKFPTPEELCTDAACTPRAIVTGSSAGGSRI